MAVLDSLMHQYSAYTAIALAIFAAFAFLLRRVPLLALRRKGRVGITPRLRPTSSKDEKDTGRSQCESSYVDMFPPSSREELRRVLPQVSSAPIDPALFRHALIGWEDDGCQCDDSQVLSSQISVGEVRQLGDFPDYATLSGVPLPDEYEGFVLEKAKHRPYRPFRWAYHQTMSLQKLETNWWLELEHTYTATLKHRLELFAQYPDSILACLPGAEIAAKEMMEMALQFYCARYPKLFSLSKGAKGWVFHNGILEQDTVIADYEPLHVLLRNVPEDFALMLRNPADGKYYLRGGVICSSLGWNLGTKIGMQLRDVHEPVPYYKAKMEFSMDRFFAKLATQKPIQRGAWGFEIDQPLFSPPGEGYDGVREAQDPALALERIHLRVDWQTLRRLPLSGAIAFNYKAVFTPLTQFRTEPYVPSLVYQVLTHAKDEIQTYKNVLHTQHVILPVLRKWIDEQIVSGLIEENWSPETLEQNPFYPGWEEQWRQEQGF